MLENWQLALLSCVGATVVLYIWPSAHRFPVPPGPKPKFWTGNVHQLPTSNAWVTYMKWSQQYGPVVFFRIFSRQYVVLNTVKAAIDLLESRSGIYSDRPRAWMYKELAGRKWAVFNIYIHEPRHKQYRKLLHSGLNPRATDTYRQILEDETEKFLQGLAVTPDQFISHIRRYAGANILKVAYGWTVSGNDDYFVKIMEESIGIQAQATQPGRWLVDSYPIIRFLPRWFPFTDFHRHADYFREQLNRVDFIPHAWAKEQIQSGNYVESFTSLHLRPESGEVPDAEQEDIIKWCSSALYAGGADTIVAVITAFFLAMTLYPEVQKRAQAEVAAVVADGLPTLDHQKSLPYVSALIKEVLRWAPAAPLGLPHRVTQDDIYEGCRILKGATIVGNIWALAHDESVYPNPSEFKPERHLEDNEPQLDPRKIIFGFGRRICPGAHFAEVSLFLSISNILASFDISKAIDKDGREIDPVIEFTPGITAHVKPFPCLVVPHTRSTA
ncbi:hypothetical protein SERLA73DRAFT_96479 [Serpula lacrymans var. lacrymans S7.3]|uniref:Cytochrome P450 n=2 Tax=Serpula lacrymans var. lacrymans TaxID=341189 RepID=F8QAZ5_SERL3|nr:uncharacterized protein SERLADRAFT_478275 [Serpula lacrymans var. lacrymans S7.9]EGN94381.1 hypothetical protein SERLA73DRAFT_96479 [Serpula lacrymans var. lacrymans S7.3]EGO19864.1 hypothetical protein SERLADRAFT_478275 [Serpula lacrymans var. lacrymans S7.9]